jgi:hypothetical protein
MRSDDRLQLADLFARYGARVARWFARRSVMRRRIQARGAASEEMTLITIRTLFRLQLEDTQAQRIKPVTARA